MSLDYATRMAMRAIISGLRYSQRITDNDCKAVVEALDEAGTEAAGKVRGHAAAELDMLVSEIARDSFGRDHPLAVAIRAKTELGQGSPR